MSNIYVLRAEKCRVIAEKVMGWSPEYPDSSVWMLPSGERAAIPDYFTDHAASMAMIERMSASVGPSGIASKGRYKNMQWCCIVNVHWCDLGGGVGYGPTPMHAVAEAAYQLAMSKEKA